MNWKSSKSVQYGEPAKYALGSYQFLS